VHACRQGIREQQGLATDDMRLSLIQFDSREPFELVYDSTPIANVPELTHSTFQPRGGTPLYDALAATIHHADNRSSAAEAAVVVVFSDGAENSSREWDRDGVFQLIEERQKDKKWAFVFLGANQDSYATGARVGISASNTQNFAFDEAGVSAAMSSLSRATSSNRVKLQEAGMSLGAKAATMTYGGSADFFEGAKEAEEELQSRKITDEP